jgi:predicted MFS family arabinose efflux permease
MHDGVSAAATRVPRATLLLAIAAFASGSNLRVADPLIPKLSHDFSVPVGAAAYIVAAFTLAYGSVQSVSGPLADRAGKLRTVGIALLIAAAGSFACFFAPSLPALIGLRFITGIGAGGIIPLALAFIADNVAYEKRQAAFGRFMGAILLGQAFGPLIGGVLSDHMSWRMVFLLLGALFLSVSAPLLLEARRHPAPPIAAHTQRFNPFARYRELLADRWVRVVVSTVGIEGFLFYGGLAYLGAYLKQRFDLGYGAIGLIVAGFSLGGLLYSLSVQPLVRRLGEKGLVRGGGRVLLICFVGIVTAPIWWSSVPFFIAIGFGFYMFHNTLQTRGSEMAPHARGSAVSLFAFSLFLGQAAGVAAFGIGISLMGYVPMLVGAGVGLAVLGEWFRRRLISHRAEAMHARNPKLRG